MHNVEINENGHIRGWISGEPNGAPRWLHLTTGSNSFSIAAAEERPDVLAAGHTLFSGFCLTMSAAAGSTSVSVRIENETYHVRPLPREDADLLHLDTADESLIEGWIDTDEAPVSLCWSDGRDLIYPERISRPDIVALKASMDRDGFGFRVTGEGLSLPRFCMIDASHVHIFASAFVTEKVAA